jgi:hypothetical protein
MVARALAWRRAFERGLLTFGIVLATRDAPQEGLHTYDDAACDRQKELSREDAPGGKLRLLTSRRP